MELFVINRYDEPKEKVNQESSILEKLQNNIEQQKKIKKKKKAEHLVEDIPAPEANERPEKKRKRKSVTIEDEKEDDIKDDLQPQKNGTSTFEYTVLGSNEKQEDVKSIEMVLPRWLAHPDIISSDLTQPGLEVKALSFVCEVMKKNLKGMNIKHLFPVQEKLIPWILASQKKPLPFRPQDACVSAVTGSGKTLGYAIPIVQHLMENQIECKVEALIMLPVFELAKQVFHVFEKLCNNLKIRCILLSKNRPLEVEQAMMVKEKGEGNFSSKVNIIISTGGRLVEHIHFTKGLDLKSLKFLVIDEADHAMAQMHNDWYYHYQQHISIINELQSNRLSYRDLLGLVKDDGGFKLPQKLLLSATLSQDPEKISVFNLFQPKLFTTSDNSEDLRMYQARKVQEGLRGQFIGKYTTPAELTELYCITEYKLKPLTLFGLIKTNNWKRFLCFTNTVEASHRLSFVLQTLFGKDLVIEELSSFLPMKIRQKVLQKFSNGHVNGLICSDALARGIDIANIDVVISYDLPKQLKTYIHRIGRTARAGQLGKAVTLIAPDQIKTFENLLQTSNKTSVTELQPSREVEEMNALNYANVLKKLQKALEIEEKHKKKLHVKSGGISLFEKLQNQVKEPEVVYEALPEAWKPENMKTSEDNSTEKRKQTD